MARDNFSQKVIDQLRDRVAHRCSNPECRVPTSAPSHTGHGVNNIGVAAHITAASPNGPRYDSSMTPDNRKSFENGIWLCSNCSIKIDRDYQKYSVELIKQWKSIAESKALLEVGRKIPNDDDAIGILTSALTANPNKLAPLAISNIHKAAQKTFELLDPRFNIKTAHVNGVTSFEISAKVPVTINIKPIKNNNDLLQRLNKAIENAEAIKLNYHEMILDGSALIEKIFEESSGFTIAPKSIVAVERVFIASNKSVRPNYIESVHGEITVGTKVLKFNGAGFHGVLLVSQRIFIEDAKFSASGDVSFQINHWAGLDIRYIPDFDKLYDVIKSFAEGQDIEFHLEVNGSLIGKLRNKFNDRGFFAELENYLHFIKCCREIAFFFDLCLRCTNDLQFSAEDHRNAYELSSLLKTKKYLATDLTSNISCNITVGEGGIDIIQSALNDDPMEFVIEEILANQIVIMGEKIPDLIKTTTIHNSTLKINGPTIIPGARTLVEFVPGNDFFCEITCEKKK